MPRIDAADDDGEHDSDDLDHVARMQRPDEGHTVEQVPNALAIHHQKETLVRRLRLNQPDSGPRAGTVLVMGSRLPELASVAAHTGHVITTRRADGKGRISLAGLDQLGWEPGPLAARTAGPWIELAPTDSAPGRNSSRLLAGCRLTLSTGVRRQTGDEPLVVIDPPASRLFVASPAIVLSLFAAPSLEEELSA